MVPFLISCHNCEQLHSFRCRPGSEGSFFFLLLSFIAGNDVTLLGYGAQIQVLRHARRMAQEQLNVSCDLIDLRTVLPWDVDTVANVWALSDTAVTVYIATRPFWLLRATSMDHICGRNLDSAIHNFSVTEMAVVLLEMMTRFNPQACKVLPAWVHARGTSKLVKQIFLFTYSTYF